MNKNKILMIAVLLIVTFLFAVVSILEKKKSESLKSVYSVVSNIANSTQNVIGSSTQDLTKNVTSSIKEEILFYGDGCPHCANVENFINNNGILAKIPLIEKEVYNNKDNFDEFSAKAKLCGIESNSLVVPFLWTSSECVLGDTPIIDYLKNQI